MQTTNFRIQNIIPDLFRQVRAWITLRSPRLAQSSIGKVERHWRERIDDVLCSPDNARIERVPDAGKIKGYHITMHNGVKVCCNGYCGSGMLNMLIENKGVHEPQEEYAFEKIIGYLPEQCKMLELGAYWGFYSLSLLQQRPKAKCWLVEPDLVNMVSGKINFRLNGRKGKFVNARVDAKPDAAQRIISVDSFCKAEGIDHLDILHADIQEHEVSMLEGASFMLASDRLDYVFISTHSNDLHEQCIKILRSHKYSILAESNLNQTYSWDGLIVAKRIGIKNPESLTIANKPQLADDFYKDFYSSKRAPFVVVIGTVGSGKTSLIRDLIKFGLDQPLNSEAYHIAECGSSLLREDGEFCNVDALFNSNFVVVDDVRHDGHELADNLACKCFNEKTPVIMTIQNHVLEDNSSGLFTTFIRLLSYSTHVCFLPHPYSSDRGMVLFEMEKLFKDKWIVPKQGEFWAVNNKTQQGNLYSRTILNPEPITAPKDRGRFKPRRED